MTVTRRVLLAENTLLRAQLAACSPESRKSMRARLASGRETLTKIIEANDTATDAAHFARLVEPLIPAVRAAAR